MKDLQREIAIQQAAREIEEAMARYAETNCFSDRAEADAARLRMEALIRGRNEQHVKRMERQKGIV